MSTAADPEPSCGVLLVDKPSGMSSHQVVGRLRRAFDTRRVGHAGTLDPMATGVLVTMIGEATKLSPYLLVEDKQYEATVRLGTSTDTLDTEGEISECAELPAWWFDDEQAKMRIAQAIESECMRSEQLPPAYSAIKVQGRRAYALMRAGKTVDLPPRPVKVQRLELLSRDQDAKELHLSLTVSKGYYVRSLARDLGQQLALPAHLTALRRTASGQFPIADARPLDHPSLRDGLIPLARAAAITLPTATLNPDGVTRARHGQALKAGDFVSPPPPSQPTAWMDDGGRLIAIGVRDGEDFKVRRGFSFEPPRSSSDID